MVVSDTNSFEPLVAGMNASDRREMLRKIAGGVDPETQILESARDVRVEANPLEEKIKTESIFLRIWLYIKSLFASSDVQYEYNAHLLSKMAAEIERNFPDVINYKKGFLLTGFYNHLCELRKSADFFKPAISLYEEDPGKFYLILSSLLIPEFTLAAEESISLNVLPPEKQPSTELRVSMLRKLDDLLSQIPSAARNNMYAAVRNTEWLKNFTKMPFDRFIMHFVVASGNIYTCPIDSSTNEIGQFARVLVSGKRMHPEVLEALSGLSAEAQKKEDDEGVSQKSEDLLKRSIEQISAIKIFITAIPVRTIACLAFRTTHWEPEPLEGVEDWFVKFKAQWKKTFDTQWALWVNSKKKEEIKNKICTLLSVKEFPVLPNRPWVEVLDGIPFAHEYSAGFLYTFFNGLYNEYNKSFKILMTEGEFVQRDNRIEFTDTYNELNHLEQEVQNFNKGLAPDGDRGKLFAKILKENIRTLSGRSQMEALMLSIESDAALFAGKFNGAVRPMLGILGAITDDVHDVHYGTLQNLSMIQGKQNAQFRAHLKAIRDGFLVASTILRELDSMENAG